MPSASTARARNATRAIRGVTIQDLIEPEDASASPLAHSQQARRGSGGHAGHPAARPATTVALVGDGSHEGDRPKSGPGQSASSSVNTSQSMRGSPPTAAGSESSPRPVNGHASSSAPAVGRPQAAVRASPERPIVFGQAQRYMESSQQQRHAGLEEIRNGPGPSASAPVRTAPNSLPRPAVLSASADAYRSGPSSQYYSSPTHGQRPSTDVRLPSIHSLTAVASQGSPYAHLRPAHPSPHAPHVPPSFKIERKPVVQPDECATFAPNRYGSHLQSGGSQRSRAYGVSSNYREMRQTPPTPPYDSPYGDTPSKAQTSPLPLLKAQQSESENIRNRAAGSVPLIRRAPSPAHASPPISPSTSTVRMPAPVAPPSAELSATTQPLAAGLGSAEGGTPSMPSQSSPHGQNSVGAFA